MIDLLIVPAVTFGLAGWMVYSAEKKQKKREDEFEKRKEKFCDWQSDQLNQRFSQYELLIPEKKNLRSTFGQDHMDMELLARGPCNAKLFKNKTTGELIGMFDGEVHRAGEPSADKLTLAEWDETIRISFSSGTSLGFGITFRLLKALDLGMKFYSREEEEFDVKQQKGQKTKPNKPNLYIVK